MFWRHPRVGKEALGLKKYVFRGVSGLFETSKFCLVRTATVLDKGHPASGTRRALMNQAHRWGRGIPADAASSERLEAGRDPENGPLFSFDGELLT